MRHFYLLTLVATILSSSCQAQTSTQARPDLYQCEGCDGGFERDAKTLTWQANISVADEPGDPLIIRGTIFKAGEKTPAKDIVIYAYQTNAAGLYANGTPETQWSRRHGNLRGWLKTGADGRYEFKTIKPAPYPNTQLPAHVHFTILEPGKRPYWIDDIVFEGEVGVTEEYRKARENRGGDGISKLTNTNDGTLLVVRDIVLEPHPN